MKKIIKLAAAFAVSGAMLATVGCQQIYEDIDDINAEIEQIEGTDLAMLRSEIQNCIADIAKLESAYKEDDAALKAEITAAYQAADLQLMASAQALATQLTTEYGQKMTELQNALNQAVQAFTKEISTLQGTDGTVGDEIKGLKAADATLAADILAAIKQFQGADAELKAADEAIKVAISTLESKLTGADATLKEELLATLNASKAALEKAIADQKAAFEKALAEQKAALEKALAEQKAAFEKAASDSNSAYRKALEDQKAAIEKALADGDDALSLAISQLEASLALEISGVKADVAGKYAALLTEINNRESSLKAADNTLKLAIAAGDSINAKAIADAKTALEGSLATAKSELEAAIENGLVGVNGRVDSLAGVTVKIASDLADLKTLVSDYEADLYAKIKADSVLANSSIDAIKADYLAKYAELAGVDANVQKTIDSLKGVFSTKIGALETEDGNLNAAISGLRTEYEGKVAQFELDLKKLSVADSATIARIDTLVAGVYARIAAVNDALVSSIAQTLTDAKAYTDAQIQALDLEAKLASVRSDFADSIKAIRDSYISQVDVVDGKYKAIVDKLVTKIQSIVAVPSAQYQIVSFTFNNMPAGPEKIRASFEVLPKEAVEKITSANAQLHVRMALSPYDQPKLNDVSGSRVPKLVKDTVLTGSALDSVAVDKAAGVVTIVAALDTQKDENGKTVFADREQKIYFSLGVSDFSATYNDVQSEYVAATFKSCELKNCWNWYVADTLYEMVLSEEGDYRVVDTAANKYCYNEGAKNFGIEATLKFDASFADGATSKNVKELGEYLGDSLYVTYSVAGNTIGSGASAKEIKVALQDSTDATYAAKFKAVPDTSKSANTSIGAYEITVTPTLMSKKQGEIKVLPVWKAKYEVTKLEHNATYNLTNDWAFNKGTNINDSIVFAIDKADSAYFVAKDVTDKNNSKTWTKRALNTSGNNVKITKSLADNSKLMFQYRTAQFDSVALKDTVVIPYDNGTNYGKVTLAITSGAAPVFRGSASIENLNLDTLKAHNNVFAIDFHDVVPYFNGKADSSWTGINGTRTQVFKNSLALTANKTTTIGQLKNILKVNKITDSTYNAKVDYTKLAYDSTYVDTVNVSAKNNANFAKIFYEFPFSFKTVDCPFKVINTQTLDSLTVTGYLKSGDTLKFHHDSIDVKDCYKVVNAADSSNYTATTETVIVNVTCGNETKTSNTKNGALQGKLFFKVDSLLKYQTIFASSVYRTNISNNEKVESKKFVEKSPITAFTIKDSIEVVRTQSKADTIRLDGAIGYVIKIEASDITLENAWDSLVWKAQGEDFFGALKFIDNTDVLLKVSDRVVSLDGIKQNVNGFEMKLDPATNKPIVVIDEGAQKANYQISVPYVAHKYMGTEEITGTLVLKFNKE